MMSDRIIAVRNNKTIYRDGDACIKVFGAGFSKAMVLNEALNQARAEETGLNIPKIREVTKTDGKWAIVSDYIKGKTLGALMAENPEQKAEYLDRFAELHLKILSNECSGLFKIKDKLNDKITASGLPATVRYELHARLNSMPKQEKLCHGDFNPENVIISENGEAFIIDWSHAVSGNPSADAAQTYVSFCLNGDTDAAETYISKFCEKSGTEIHNARKWITIVSAAKLLTSNEKEREFLMTLIDITDN